MTIIFRLARRYTVRRLLQSVLFVLGVALGVAVIIAIDLANASATRAFALSTESVTGRATHQIEGSGAGLPTEVFRQVRADLGIAESAPVIEGYVTAASIGGLPLRVLGVDPLSEDPFRSYLTDATLDSGEVDNGDALNAFIARPGTALTSRTLAERFGFAAGDTINVISGADTYELVVVGLLQPSDSVSAQALEDLLLTDIATAQTVVGEQGRITRIDLILSDDAQLGTIQSALPDGARLVSVSEGNSTIAQMTEAFDINLQALSLLALVVGAFLIYNTVTFNVVQRRPVIGTLRALGTTRQQIFTLILSEALLLTVIGVVLGMGLGIILGRGAVLLVSQAVNNLYLTVNVNTVTVPTSALLKGAGIGLFMSTAAAVIPSFDATRTPPAGVMRRSTIEDQTVKLLPYITGVAVVLNLVGVGLLLFPSDSIWLSFIALFCIVLGSALFTPSLLVVVMRLSTPLMGSVFGVLGRMAPRAVSRSLSRTSVAVAALTVAVSVIVGVSVMIASFRNTVGDWLETTLNADIYIAPPALTANRASVGMSPDVRALVEETEGVTAVSSARGITVASPDYPDMPPVNLTAIETNIPDWTRTFIWNAAPDGDLLAAMDAGMVMVSEPFA
ncbi:MAG: FtsX-like permease family protein, partial [Chloroflexota bacterium]